ncbi:hypothetical protein NDA00_26640 [Funiculus sociatus GB2-M2]|uniref:hypothetical protein n=1 Tax=Funiculus sociatus TaxID=450527 RepID=UPI00329A5603
MSSRTLDFQHSISAVPRRGNRTFAWLDNARALCRDYEELPENHEGMVYVVMIRLMLRRLGNNRRTRKAKNA